MAARASTTCRHWSDQLREPDTDLYAQAMNASNGGATGPQLQLQQQLEHDVENKWESYKEYYS